MFARPCLCRRAFTLVEILVVIGIIAVLIAVLLPTLAKARQISARTKCLSNVRQLCVAQANYAAVFQNALIAAADGSYDVQGSWIGVLEGSRTVFLARRCPSDFSRYYDSPLPLSPPPPAAPLFRVTSYAINNYVSPTHSPIDPPLKKITQVKRSSDVIQFVELAQTGDYAGADHVHAADFYPAAVPPKVVIGLIGKQMPVGIHGGKPLDWQAMLNFGFVDGHAESLRIRDVYTDSTRNRFDPQVAR